MESALGPEPKAYERLTLHLNEEDSGARPIDPARTRDDESTKFFNNAEAAIPSPSKTPTLDTPPALKDLAAEAKLTQRLNRPGLSDRLADFGALLKASTIDKWMGLRELSERKDQERRIAKNERDIQKSQQRAAELERTITATEKTIKDEQAEAAKVLSTLQDPTLRALFEAAAKKTNENSIAELDKYNTEREQIALDMGTFRSREEGFKSNITLIEKDLEARIDRSIDEIKFKNGYEDRVNLRTKIGEEIAAQEKDLEKRQAKIAEYQQTLIAGKKFLASTPEAVSRLHELVSQMQAETRVQQQELIKARKVRFELDEGIESIEKKIGKWTKLKESYGLVKAPTPALRIPEPEPTPVTPEPTPAPEPVAPEPATPPPTAEPEPITGAEKTASEATEKLNQLIEICRDPAQFIERFNEIEAWLWETQKNEKDHAMQQSLLEAWREMMHTDINKPQDPAMQDAINEVNLVLTHYRDRV